MQIRLSTPEGGFIELQIPQSEIYPLISMASHCHTQLNLAHGEAPQQDNPWFKRGTLFRSAVDVLRRAGGPMTAREIAEALIADKAPQATRKQA